MMADGQEECTSACWLDVDDSSSGPLLLSLVLDYARTPHLKPREKKSCIGSTRIMIMMFNAELEVPSLDQICILKRAIYTAGSEGSCNVLDFRRP